MTDEQPNVNEALANAVRKSSISSVASGDMPTGAAIVASIGGVRGLVESILPSFVFLIVYLITKDVWLSALVPVGVAVLFIIVRVATKLPVGPAVTGAVGVGITAALAIVTGRAENNFVLGILTNAGYLVAMLVSLVVRRPLIGVIVGLLMGERAANWRQEPRRYRVLTLVTWVWVALFGIRLVIEVPLYLAGNVAGLAIAKLILGVPLYAVVLWVTWLLVRSVFPPEAVDSEGAPSKVS
jgi:hypothetical protein